MSKRGNRHQVPARVRQREDNRGEDVKAVKSKQVLARQTARFAERAGRDTIMGTAPPEQHVRERRQTTARVQSPSPAVAEPAQPANATRDEPPRYLLDDARKLVGLAVHLAFWPLRQARAIVRGMLAPKDVTA